jgi:hypothetical protein
VLFYSTIKVKDLEEEVIFQAHSSHGAWEMTSAWVRRLYYKGCFQIQRQRWEVISPVLEKGWALRPIQTGRDSAITRREFSMTFNFNIFLCFSNIRNHLSNFCYLVCIYCKMFIRWRFYLVLKTENSRRVVESRSVCVGLNCYCCEIYFYMKKKQIKHEVVKNILPFIPLNKWRHKNAETVSFECRAIYK